MQILLLLSTPTVLARKFSCSVVSIWKLLQLNLHLLRFYCPPTASELYRLTLTSFWLTLGAVAWLFFVAFFSPVCRFHFPIPVLIPIPRVCACLSVHCGAVVGDSRRKSSSALEQCNPLPGDAPCSRIGQAHRYTRRTGAGLAAHRWGRSSLAGWPSGEWESKTECDVGCCEKRTKQNYAKHTHTINGQQTNPKRNNFTIFDELRRLDRACEMKLERELNSASCCVDVGVAVGFIVNVAGSAQWFNARRQLVCSKNSKTNNAYAW